MSAALIDRNLELIDQGIRLLRWLPDDAYRAAPAGGSLAPAVGPHFRHCLEFYTCFLDGLGHGRIDYHRRARDRDVERRRETAIARLVAVVERVRRIDPGALDTQLVLGSEDAAGDDRPIRSTIGRELFFLASHTVHHYALVALALRLEGFRVPASFGVAPETLEHWRRAGVTG